MKRFITALGICAVFLTPSTADAALRTWDDGGADDNWSTALNWAPNFVPATGNDITITTSSPSIYDAGMSDTSFGAFIVGGSITLQVDNDDITFTSTSVAGDWELTSTQSRNMTAGPMSLTDNAEITNSRTLTASSLTIDASSAARTLTLAGAGIYDIYGAVTLTGGDADTEEAELEVSSGTTCQPNSFDLNGGSGSTRRAILDLNESVTVQTGGTDIAQYVDIEIASGKTFTTGPLTIGDKTDGTGYWADVDINDGGTVTASSVVIEGGPSDSTMVTVTSGTLQTN